MLQMGLKKCSLIINNCTETVTHWQMVQIIKHPYSQYISSWNISLSPLVPADSSKAPVRQEHSAAFPRMDGYVLGYVFGLLLSPSKADLYMFQYAALHTIRLCY